MFSTTSFIIVLIIIIIITLSSSSSIIVNAQTTATTQVVPTTQPAAVTTTSSPSSKVTTTDESICAMPLFSSLKWTIPDQTQNTFKFTISPCQNTTIWPPAASSKTAPGVSACGNGYGGWTEDKPQFNKTCQYFYETLLSTPSPTNTSSSSPVPSPADGPNANIIKNNPTAASLLKTITAHQTLYYSSTSPTTGLLLFVSWKCTGLDGDLKPTDTTVIDVSGNSTLRRITIQSRGCREPDDGSLKVGVVVAICVVAVFVLVVIVSVLKAKCFGSSSSSGGGRHQHFVPGGGGNNHVDRGSMPKQQQEIAPGNDAYTAA